MVNWSCSFDIYAMIYRKTPRHRHCEEGVFPTKQAHTLLRCTFCMRLLRLLAMTEKYSSNLFESCYDCL